MSGAFHMRVSAHVRPILRLTRWDEHVLFTVPATLLGTNLALDRSAVGVDWRVAAVLVANVLAVAFAFMVNDIEDASDDARDLNRAERNVIASGALSPRVAWWVAWAIAGAALLVFVVISTRVLAAGSLTIVLGWLYSWRSVRLKALPVVDVLAHVLMLSALLMMAGYATYESDFLAVGWVVIGVSLISAYGQLYNQLRDFEADRAARLNNTACILGLRSTRRAMGASLVGAAVSLVIAVVTGIIPAWFVVLLLGLSPLLVAFYSAQDMRGTTAIDLSGRLQTGAMVIATLALMLWLVGFMVL